MNYLANNPYKGTVDVKDFEIFKSLTKEQIALINQNLSCTVQKRGALIYYEGTRITGSFLVVKGILKIYKTGVEGKEQIIRFAKPGDLIGFRSIVSEELACTSTKVVQEAVLAYFSSTILSSLLQENAKFSMTLMKLTCKELGESNKFLTDIAQKTVRERLAEVLLLLMDTFELDKDNVLQISLTREELANMVGTATESVIRLLSEFKRSKLIALNGRRIKFLDIPRLIKEGNIFV